MKKVLLLLSFVLIAEYAYSECVHEKQLLGAHLIKLEDLEHDIMVMTDDERFVPKDQTTLNPLKVYSVQFVKKQQASNLKNGRDFTRYNQTHIEYYQFHNLKRFVQNLPSQLGNTQYETVIVGKSIEGRDLYSYRPVNFDSNKKTIVMFGRHHGDEGTANWIIEGFMQDFQNAHQKFHQDYQLILYPMINPDGAQAQTRYNKNGRDLNRSWDYDPSQSFDEAQIIHKDLKKYLGKNNNIKIVLDMHGSFTNDFIYRVDEAFAGVDFYQHQQKFIDELKSWDPFQFGNFILSNGHPKMARIVMIKSYNLHALTHETPRDIKLVNSRGRSKATLMEQGSGIFESILALY